jgi:hypothetical protein
VQETLRLRPPIVLVSRLTRQPITLVEHHFPPTRSSCRLFSPCTGSRTSTTRWLSHVISPVSGRAADTGRRCRVVRFLPTPKRVRCRCRRNSVRRQRGGRSGMLPANRGRCRGRSAGRRERRGSPVALGVPAVLRHQDHRPADEGPRTTRVASPRLPLRMELQARFTTHPRPTVKQRVID